MRKLTILLCILTMLAPPAAGSEAKTDGLAPLARLLGDWTGVSDGEPGTAATTRHAVREHDDHFVVVEGRSVYPKQDKNKSGEIHTQLDIWSFDKRRKLIVLREFDSLGFVSTYVQDPSASAKDGLVLVSEILENVPPSLKARYTFTFKGPDEYHELFELDEGKGFQTYVSGRFLRTPSAQRK